MACESSEEGERFVIVGAQTQYRFEREDVVSFKSVCSGGAWVKWFMRFADGKVAVVTSHVDDPAERSDDARTVPLERFFGDLLFKDEPASSGEGAFSRLPSTPAKDDRIFGEKKPISTKIAVILSWGGAALTVLAYLINLFINLTYTTDLAWMFRYIEYGYIAGFIMMGIGAIATVIGFSLLLKLRPEDDSAAAVHKIAPLIIVAETIMVALLPLM